MKRFTRTAIASLALGISSLTAADSLMDAIKGGKPTFQLRVRYESADYEATNETQDAIFTRLALGYKTGTYNGFSGYFQVDDVSTILTEPDYTVAAPYGILDPEDADVNQAYLKYAKDNLSVILGRQTIIYDNARHIGNVGWRMNDQTFDAATLKYTAGKLNLSYNYVWQANRIVYLEEDMESHFLNASIKLKPGKLVAYYYKVDFDIDDVGFFDDTDDTDTYGLSFTGKHGKFLYALEVASQSDGGDAEDNGVTPYDATYTHAMLGYNFGPVTLKVGQETLGSDSGTGSFVTPFGTVHAFQGWSDRNLPLKNGTNGIVDTYAALSGKFKGVKLLGTYRTLETDEGSTDIGDEINLVAVYKTKLGPVVGAKAAYYSSDTPGDDVDKLWIWTEIKF